MRHRLRWCSYLIEGFNSVLTPTRLPFANQHHSFVQVHDNRGVGLQSFELVSMRVRMPADGTEMIDMIAQNRLQHARFYLATSATQ